MSGGGPTRGSPFIREIPVDPWFAERQAPEENARLRWALESALQELLFYNAKRAKELAAKHGVAEPMPTTIPTHRYVPHPKYPWFCKSCGYPAHERLKHDPPSRRAGPKGRRP